MKNTTIAIFILLFAFLVGSFYFMNQNSQILEANNTLKSGMDSLQQVKQVLQEEIDSLQHRFTAILQEKDSVNHSLLTELTSVQALLTKQNAKLKKMRGNSTKDLAELKAQVVQLADIRDSMQLIIEQVTQNQEELANANAALTETLEASEQTNEALTYEVEDLREINTAQMEELNHLRAKALQATNFQIGILTKNAQATANRRNARDIMVEFDLHEVPEEFQGAHTIFLVIRDVNSLPIPSTNPVKATIQAPDERVELIAQQSKPVTLIPSQRLTIQHEIAGKLAPGVYRAAVYYEHGLLGAAFFRLK